MKLNITPEDHNKAALLDPGYYPCIIRAQEEKVSKGDASAYTEVKFEVLEGPYKGAVLFTNFSEKAPGFAIEFFKALGANIDKSKTTEVDFASIIGKKILVNVRRGEWNGKPKNEVNGYRPIA